jgi:hypothetical protein
MKKFFIFYLISLLCQFALSQNHQWLPTKGPQGCDATSFFVDKKGNYWLGTGSSGGVYFSKNKGKTWEARNNRIGPVHVAHIAEIKDTLYIQVSDNTFGRDSNIRFYWWKPKTKEWKIIQRIEIRETDYRNIYRYLARVYKGQNIDSVFSDNPKLALAIKNVDSLKPIIKRDTIYNTDVKWLSDTLSAMAQLHSKVIQKKYPLDLSNKPGTWYSYIDYLSGDWGVYPHTVSWGAGFGGVWDGRVATHISGFADSLGSFTNLNKSFPRDMYVLPAGNIFYGKDQKTLLLLSKSGIYQLEQNNISLLPTKGLCATDVRQIICIGNRLVVLVGESDIWEYSNNQWKILFNAWEHHKSSGSWHTIGGFDTKQLNALPDGRILFCFCGDVWQISSDGLASQLFSQPVLPEQISIDSALIWLNDPNAVTDSGFPNKVRLYYTGVSMDKDSSYWAVGNWMPQGSGYYSTVLVKIPSVPGPHRIIKQLDETAAAGNSIYCYTFNDKAGGVWLRSGRKIRQIGTDADTSLSVPAYMNQWLSSVALQNDGSFSYINEYDTTIYHYNYKLKIVEQLPVPELEDMKCIGYDSDNNLYAGTGKEYRSTCGNYMSGRARGLFKLENGRWKNIPGEPNKWILSIGSGYPGGGIPVGTSGSGMWMVK